MSSSIVVNSKYDLTKSPNSKTNTFIYSEAIEYYRKLCVKNYTHTNTQIVNLLKAENTNIYLDSYNFKEISILGKVLVNFSYMKSIVLSPTDPVKSSQNKNSNIINNLNKPNRSQHKHAKSEKEANKAKREEEQNFKAKIEVITTSLSKHLSNTTELKSLKIFNFNFNEEIMNTLSTGLKENNSIQNLIVNTCTFNNNIFDKFCESLLNHMALEYFDISNNNLSDKSGSSIGRIITRHNQRRDQVIWMYGLRNEKPLNTDFAKGLTSINISNNNLSNSACSDLVYALSNDNYIRKLVLKNNSINEEGCKNFSRLLRTNNSLLNIDLRNNPGFNVEEIRMKIYMKLANNIKAAMMKDMTKEEKNNLSKMINFNYFDVEIPEYSK